MAKKVSKNKMAKAAVIGTSLAGLVAGAYFLLSPKTKKYRQHAKSWAIKMKGEVIEKLEKAKEITEPMYHEIIDTVAKDYKKAKKVTSPEIDAIAADLRKHWKSVSKIALKARKEVIKDAKKMARKTTKVAKKKRA